MRKKKEEKSFEREARTAFEGRARRKIYGFLIKQSELRPFSRRGAISQVASAVNTNFQRNQHSN